MDHLLTLTLTQLSPATLLLILRLLLWAGEEVLSMNIQTEHMMNIVFGIMPGMQRT